MKTEFTGSIFGRLTVRESRPGNNWLCSCACGKEKVIYKSSLLGGRTRSCGCLASESTKTRNHKHGEAKRTKEYTAWACMLQRCRDPKSKSYPDYGGRGVKVCEEWENSFSAFLLAVGRAPSPKHSIGRVNNDLGYQPGNCEWQTSQVQNSNTRRNRFIVIDGVKKTASEWGRESGVKPHTILNRIDVLGWNELRAVTKK